MWFRSRRSDEEVTHELSEEWVRFTVQWVQVEGVCPGWKGRSVSKP